jgi:hypothetical protein
MLLYEDKMKFWCSWQRFIWKQKEEQKERNVSGRENQSNRESQNLM